MNLSRDQEERVRIAIGALVNTTPAGEEYEDIVEQRLASAKNAKRGVVAFGAAFVGVLLVGIASLFFFAAETNEQATGDFDQGLLQGATKVAPEEIKDDLMRDIISPRSNDSLFLLADREYEIFALVGESGQPHLYTNLCEALAEVDFRNDWRGTCLQRTIDGVPVTGIFDFPISVATNAYEDVGGRIWHSTDCPGADVLLLAVADALPHVDDTKMEKVQRVADSSPEYRVIPRNGWVWDRLDDGTVLVYQVEDFMLERVAADSDECPDIPAYATDRVPVAYRIEGR